MSIEKFTNKSRINKQSIPFTQVNRNVIQNIQDIQAGFVWVYLLSMPSDWVVLKTHIKKHFNLGDLKLKKIFSCLKAHYLIDYEPVKDPDTGRILHWDIHVLNGENFIKNPEKNNKKSTGSKNHPVETHTYGNRGTTYKTDNKEDKKKQREGKIEKPKKITEVKKTPPVKQPPPETYSLSFFNDPDNIFNFIKYNQMLKRCARNGIEPSNVLEKFINDIKNKGLKEFSEAQLNIWCLREISYTQKKRSA